MRQSGVIFILFFMLGIPGRAAEYQSGDTTIRVEGLKNGETLRYPVPILRGTLPASATSFEIINTSSSRDSWRIPGTAHAGRFTGITELVPGENLLLLKAGKQVRKWTLHYQPQQNPYMVRIVYATAKEGDTRYQSPLPDDPQNYQAKLSTAMKLLQGSFAEWMHEAGFGRRTFHLEFDTEGEVKVHRLKQRHPAGFYYRLDDRSWYAQVARDAQFAFPMEQAKNVVVAAYTRFDPETGKVQAHTALGGGGMALFGSSGMYTWPDSLADVVTAFSDSRNIPVDRVFDDSAGRRTFWSTASTTMGAVGHELGHTFGLPHVPDGRALMLRGFDRLNRQFTLVEPAHARRPSALAFDPNTITYFTPSSAACLSHSRWFNLDRKRYGFGPGMIYVYREQGGEHISIESDRPLGFVGIDSKHEICRDFERFTGKQRRHTYRLNVAETERITGSSPFHLRVMNTNGEFLVARSDRLFENPNSFVRSWQFTPEATAWKPVGVFKNIGPEHVQRLQAKARTETLTRSVSTVVDFHAAYGRKAQPQTVGYAFREIHSDRARFIHLLAGSSDAMRIWFNGDLVSQVLAYRPAEADQERIGIQLQKGSNSLLVEVSRGYGDWELILRFEDEQGRRMNLTDDGRLKPLN